MDPNVIPYAATPRVDDLYWKKVVAARRQSFEEKLLAGPKLFDQACESMRVDIHNHFPNADEAQVRGILDAILTLRRRLGND